MRINLVLELLDAPGQLVKALEPISTYGANLVTIIHKRDYKNDNGMVPVQLTIEGERNDLKNVVDKYEELGFTIIEMDGVVKKEKITTILFGHIVDQDLRDTMDKINQIDGVIIVAFDIKLNGEEKSTALINIEADVGLKQNVFDRIAEIAEEKELLVINEV
ncbi:ACT domain-containing protein [Methanobrevibacter gottschalkii]|uniref:ACT domain-containing protein n=2 Tax=Methanobrevibacter gottschalkii TaxID=190974 RepID=A0A3N5B463_9EURY|nr:MULTISPECIES: amino acid-binding protein [Methanobrevibacter]MCQ2971549.1 amino acid-binding protein [archaeon]OEC95740.1 amino acid-binding protein [Methanobrevibacter sp. A27]RPF51889.1 ACT domain-containing protein [Methanobrevibacter gottschalkii DSM 11977]SEL32198.1 ACT domain-containing protein [Methanobrevibacter gottschalkii]